MCKLLDSSEPKETQVSQHSRNGSFMKGNIEAGEEKGGGEGLRGGPRFKSTIQVKVQVEAVKKEDARVQGIGDSIFNQRFGDHQRSFANPRLTLRFTSQAEFGTGHF